MSPLRALVAHEAGAALRLLEQCAREPPFAGPLAKHNRLRVARALLAAAPAVSTHLPCSLTATPRHKGDYLLKKYL